MRQSIMFRYTNPINIKNMTNINSTQSDSQNQFKGHYNCYLNHLSFEDDPIEQFLNEEAFLDRHSPPKQNEQSNDLTSTYHMQNHSNMPALDETHPASRKKSIFHNFQKHLITLIKKFIIIPQEECHIDQHSPLKHRLWAAFKRTRSFNKKVLHMVFGVCESINAEEEMRRLAQEYSEFKAIFDKNSRQEISEAQQAIRNEVVSQAKAVDQASLRGSCSVNRFQEFYEYFQSFICELSSGPMAKRMTKTRKYVVVERLRNKQKCQ